MKYKYIFDKIVVVLWLFILLINTLLSFVVKTVGGIGYIFILFIFSLYFLIIYGHNRKVKHISMLPLVIFLIVYIVELQIIWHSGTIYYSMGVPFNLEVWHWFALAPVIVSSINIVRYSDFRLRRTLNITLLFIFCINIIFTLFSLQKYSLASKITATGAVSNSIIAGYGIVYSLAIIFPIYLARVHEEKTRKKWLLYVFIIINFIFLFKASFTIAIAGLILGTSCYLLYSVNSKILRIGGIILAISIFSYVISSNVYINVLQNISSLVPIKEVSKRMEQIAVSLSTGINYDTTIRFDLYLYSFKAFLRHPIFGNIIFESGNNYTSGHSTNLDILASCGIIVFFFYMKFIINLLKYYLSICTSTNMKAGIISAFIAFLFVSTFNPVLSGTEIMMILIIGPQCLFLNENKKLNVK